MQNYVFFVLFISFSVFSGEYLPDESLKRGDLFTDQFIHFEVDAHDYSSQNDTVRHVERVRFASKCYDQTMRDQMHLLARLGVHTPYFDVNDYQISTEVEEEPIDSERFLPDLVCKMKIQVRPNARFLLWPVYTEVFKGKKAKATCEQLVTDLDSQSEKIQLFSRRTFYQYRGLYHKARVKACQVMQLKLKPNSHYNPSPSCDLRREYKVVLSVQTPTKSELANTVAPYLKLPLKAVGYFQKIGERGLPYNQDTQLLMNYQITKGTNIPWKEIHNLKSAKLKIDYVKLVKDRHNATEILCFASDSPGDRACTGQLFYEQSWIRLMNPDFFVQTGMIKNAHYSALFPYGARLGTVIKNKVEIDVLSFTQAEGVLDALSKNKNLKFIAADDVYIAPSTELELTFNCK